MKTCNNCKAPFCQFELSSIIRGYAITDVFRFLILLGPMLSLFHACTNIQPMLPHVKVGSAKSGTTVTDYVLYKGSRSKLSQMEEEMLANIQKVCSKEYRDGLPIIWMDGQQTLYKGLYLQGIAMILPATSAISFLVFQKKDVLSSVLAAIHFLFEIVSIILSLFGAFFISDIRLCFLAHFSETMHVPVILWALDIIFAIFYKIGILCCLELYIRNYYRSKTYVYRPPAPEEELKIYLQELKSLRITPNVTIEIPDDPSKMDWEFVNAAIKRILQEIRIQVAELHRDDPLVDNLLKSGKLKMQRHHHRRRTGGSGGSIGGSGPNIMKIARMMTNKEAEYKLLKQHRHHHHQKSEGTLEEDVEVILPETSFKFDPE